MKRWTFEGLALDFMTIFVVFIATLAIIGEFK
jgi:hypothetical protein